MLLNALLPELSVPDLTRSRTFYFYILEFKVKYERPANKFMYLSREGAQLLIEQTNGHWATGEPEYSYGRGINIQFHSEDVNALNKIIEVEGIPLSAPSGRAGTGEETYSMGTSLSKNPTDTSSGSRSR